jgi:hypothetical protein
MIKLGKGQKFSEEILKIAPADNSVIALSYRKKDYRQILNNFDIPLENP